MDLIYERIFRISPVGMAIEDDRHLLVGVNEQFCRALRAQADALLDVDFEQLLPARPATGGPSVFMDPAARDDAPAAASQARVHPLHRGDGTTGRYLLHKTVWNLDGTERRALWSLVELPEVTLQSVAGGAMVALEQREWLDRLPFPIVLTDADRRIVAMNAAFLRTMPAAPATRPQIGQDIATLGDASWRRLADALKPLTSRTGHAPPSIVVPMPEGPGTARNAHASVLTALDGTRRIMVCLTGSDDAAPRPAADDDAQRQRTGSQTIHHVANALAGLAGLLQIRSARRPQARDELLNAVSQIMALSAVYSWRSRSPERLPIVPIVRSLVANRARIHSVPIPLESAADEPALSLFVASPAQTDQEAIAVILAIDELVSNAIMHRCEGGRVTAGLAVGQDQLVFEVRNDGRIASGADVTDIHPDAAGLGLVKAMLPPDAQLTLRQSGDEVVASLALPRSMFMLE